jgi:hypothetical protein
MEAAFKPLVNDELDTQNFMKFPDVSILHMVSSSLEFLICITSFQFIIRFGFSRYIAFAMHLGIHYV